MQTHHTGNPAAPPVDGSGNTYTSDVIGNKTDAAASGNTASLVAQGKQIDAFHDVPTADAADNAQLRDVIGNKEDAGSLAADVASLLAIARFGAKEAFEAETHVHAGERWFGTAAVADGELHVADRIGAGAAGAEAAPLVVDAGNDDWGAWTQILGSDDTPTDGGSATHHDFHRMVIVAAEHTAQLYFVQVSCQEDAPADDPGASDSYTEFPFVSAGVGALASIPPIRKQGQRSTSGTKCWMRLRAPNQNTGTLSFYLGLHEYTDPDT